MKTGKKGRIAVVRCGSRVRNLHTYYNNCSKSTYECLSCGSNALSRIRAGLWTCKTCKLEICGNAYFPK